MTTPPVVSATEFIGSLWRPTPTATTHPTMTTTMMPQREPTTQSQPSTHQQPSTWCLSTITSSIQPMCAGHPSSPMAAMSRVPLFAQQPRFKPYSYYYQGMYPPTQLQNNNSQGTPVQGTHSHTMGPMESSSQSNQLVHAYPTHAVYVPQTPGCNHGYHCKYGQGYANPYHMQHTMAKGAPAYPHMYDSRQAPLARFSTLASSRLASQPDSIIAASSACEVQYPRLESPGFSARLHYSDKLRMRGSVPLPRVVWLLSPTPV
ncbi:unnamed protein product [Lactuca virosa]|uniref:Uncharacterized protein n=1 Tax=Lactuca virosa TaxID=75947 RepID=A0AAU9PNT3_9ASTR|nr:unnamed protein product [Lactuca virosa]